MEGRKRRIFDIIQIGNESDLISRAFDIFIVGVILINILVLFLETFSELARWQLFFHGAEQVTTAVFIVEYLLRLWTAEYLYPGLTAGRASIRFAFSLDGLILLFSILPFFFLSGFVVFRMLRVARIFHLFRINKQFDSFMVIQSVLAEKRNQILSSVFIVLVLMLAASICMYSAEHRAQPEVFRNAFSGIWWSVSALLTVGYGDIYPVTALGQAMAIVISFLGVGAVAIPTGIISAGFVEQYQRAQSSSEGLAAGLQVVTIDLDSRWIGKRPKEILADDQIAVVLVTSGEASFVPRADYQVKVGDQLAVFREDQVTGLESLAEDQAAGRESPEEDRVTGLESSEEAGPEA